MANPQIIEGTGSEIGVLLQSEAFAGLKLRVYVDRDEEDLCGGLPNPPFTVRNQAELVGLLLHSLESPVVPVTEETFERRRETIRSHKNGS